MLDEKLFFMVNLSRLIAVSEYLRERGDKYVCIILDSIINDFRDQGQDQDTLLNLKQK